MGGMGSWFVSGLVYGRQVRLVQTSVPFANDVVLTKQRAARKLNEKSGNAVSGRTVPLLGERKVT